MSYKPEEYCFEGIDEWGWGPNIWGCDYLRLYLNMEPGGLIGGHWLCWGTFEESGNFIFDKERIKHKLEKELHTVRYCPVLDKEYVMSALESLPAVINPKKDENWAYMDEYGNVVDKVVFKDKKIIAIDEDGIESTVKIVGVIPKDTESAERILNEIRNKIRQKK